MKPSLPGPHKPNLVQLPSPRIIRAFRSLRERLIPGPSRVIELPLSPNAIEALKRLYLARKAAQPPRPKPTLGGAIQRIERLRDALLTNESLREDATMARVVALAGLSVIEEDLRTLGGGQ